MDAPDATHPVSRLCKVLFFALMVKPVVLIVLGLNLRGRERLPERGPAIVAANHNSHLDALVLMSLYPLSKIHQVRPVAAADYFLSKGGVLAWFSLNCIGIIPLDRSGGASRESLFEDCHRALDQGQILILFPEGSRGRPEQISDVKKGIYYLANDRTDTRVTPVMMHGLGRSLPKGEALLVPFNCDVVVGEPVAPADSADEFVQSISDTFKVLAEDCLTLTTDTD